MTGPASIPRQAWSRALGEGYEPAPRPRVEPPMIDDGPWAGVPIGGIGAGSIGRTQRGDFARWHLDVGRHRFESIAASQFSLFVDDGSARSAHVLSTVRPDGPPAFAFDLPVGAGTYHALFPYAWSVVDWDQLPVRIVQRQFSPVLPHNYRESSFPVGIFETTIENRSPAPVTAGLMLSWQNVLGRGAGLDRGGGQRHEAVLRDGVAGVQLGAPAAAAGTAQDGTFALLAEAGDWVSAARLFRVDDAGGLWADFADDGRLGPVDGPPATASAGGEVGAAIAATVRLEPGESRTIPFALAWDIPLAEFAVGTRWHRRYTAFFGTSGRNAVEIAATALREREAWSAAIDAWQAPILADESRPDWYASALFNELYFMVDGGTLWTDGPPMPADGWIPTPGADPAAGGPFGRFAQIECFDYPFYNTLDVDFYASFARLHLWPELERAVIREFVASVDVHDPAIVEIQWSGKPATRKCPGALPHDVGGPEDDPFLRVNAYRYQDINVWKDLNCKFVLQVWRDATVLDDAQLLRDAWPGIVTALDHVARFDRDGDGLPEHDGDPDQTYDTWPMTGPSAYCGGLWLAALRAAIEIGKRAGDVDPDADAAVARFESWLGTGTAAFESRLWAGTHYRYDDGGGASSDSIMADQLAGQWYADASGLGDVVAPERVTAALRTVFERNVAGFQGGEMGAVNGVRPDGSVDRSSEQSPEVWVGTTYALAAFMLGRGLDDEAWQTARGAWNVTYNRGLWFRTPEAYDETGNFRASLYLRPLAIWAIEHALAARAGKP
ncbi:MAG TPA: non-lysosomal glucosylceramidase [Candidatus Limnocylindrales bacterium]|nr:non-lysosomal glucosylceramidase [Candidatus Limnocylindrales bacterium]